MNVRILLLIIAFAFANTNLVCAQFGGPGPSQPRGAFNEEENLTEEQRAQLRAVDYFRLKKLAAKTWDKLLPAQAVPLNKHQTLYLDAKRKRLLLKTQVVMRNGLLEMFCCLRQTKEHESILSFTGKARDVHAGLLALGANPGEPVQFTEEAVIPPSGEMLTIQVHYLDEELAHQQAQAADWIQTATRRYFVVTMQQLPRGVTIPEEEDLRFHPDFNELTWFGIMPKKKRDEFLKLSDDDEFQAAIRKLYNDSQPKPMKADFVFAGSQFYTDPETKKVFYEAESGDLICVANFPTATIDVNIESSKDNAFLTYEAKQSAIPELGTPVLLEIRLSKQKFEKSED